MLFACIITFNLVKLDSYSSGVGRNRLGQCVHIGGSGDMGCAVSYTHLDVYKRQDLFVLRTTI